MKQYWVVTRAPGAKKGELYAMSPHPSKQAAEAFAKDLRRRNPAGGRVVITQQPKRRYEF